VAVDVVEVGEQADTGVAVIVLAVDDFVVDVDVDVDVDVVVEGEGKLVVTGGGRVKW